MPLCPNCGAFYIRSPCPSCGYNKSKSQAQIIKNSPKNTPLRAVSENAPSWESANKEMSLKRAVVQPRVPDFSPKNRTVKTDDLQEFKDEVHKTLKQVVSLIEQLLEKTA